MRPNIQLGSNTVVVDIPFGKSNFLTKAVCAAGGFFLCKTEARAEVRSLNSIKEKSVKYADIGDGYRKKAINMLCGFLLARPEARAEARALNSCKKKRAVYDTEGCGYIRFCKIRKRLKRVLRSSEVSACAVYSYWFNLPAVVGSFLYFWLKKKIPNARFVSRAHGGDLYFERSALNFLSHRELLLEAAFGVYPCSEYGARYLRQRYPQYASKIRPAHLGTRDLGVAPWNGGMDYSIVSCSNVIPLKRVDLIFDVARALLSRGLGARWVHFGDGSELPKIMAAARESGLQEKMEFRGRVPNSEVLDFYKNNTVGLFINLSMTEGLPVSIIEAMSFGIPVIATDVGGSSEIVDNSVGMLVRSDEGAESVAKKAIELMSLEKSEYKRLRERARAKWESAFNCEKNYADWCAMLLG